jgi:hypothetical protein
LYARLFARILAWPRKPVLRLSAEVMRKNVQQQSGRWAQRARRPSDPKGWTPSDIRKPWQDRRMLIAGSASRNLAHGFCVSRRHRFRETMKEDRNVQ